MMISRMKEIGEELDDKFVENCCQINSTQFTHFYEFSICF